ncbi:ankyrin repeat domain-containing protein 45 isoform 1-T2 [Discoglossus pictus]
MEVLNLKLSANPLLRYALEGDVQSLNSLFEDKAHPGHDQSGQLLVEKDLLGRSVLFPACILGHGEIVKELVKHGANINEQTQRGYLPLHCAAAWGQMEVLKVLVELGANILALNFRGEKAYDISVRYNKTECAEFLIWAEAKLAFKRFVSSVQQSITDPEKVQVKLTKEEKNLVINACKAKNEWLEQAKNPSLQDFEDQRKQLEDTVQPIVNKMNAPKADTARSSRR